MIERKFVEEKIKEFQIQQYIDETLGDCGHSHTKLKKTALGERIVVHSSRPGLVVGRKGENIKRLTRELKEKFNLENPQIEIEEVTNLYQDPKIVADRIASTLERFGSQRFKGVGHQMMQAVLDSGALGVEIVMSGRIPSSRAKTWKFYKGYLKNCGDIAVSGVKRAYSVAKLKAGAIGIKVSIMPSDLRLPDRVIKLEVPEEQISEVLEGKEEKPKKTKKATKKKAAPKKKAEEKPAEAKEEVKAEEKPAEKVEEKPAEEKAPEAPKEEAAPAEAEVKAE